jgi:hypothetical protein
MMKRLLFGLGLLLAAMAPALAADFSQWAVLVVAGDNRAHNGNPSQVFDNARKDLVKAFTGIGFAPGNVMQFSVNPDPVAQPTAIGPIATGFWDLSGRAQAGCLVYFTSHGSPDGIVVGEAQVGPDKMAAVIGNACGAKPSVIVMSACFSGQFVPKLAGDNRVVITAARPDRTSFGCGESDHYTFFDDCFLRALPLAGDFALLGGKVQECVAFREQQMQATPPSEPQVSVGRNVAATLRWK